jgi:chromosome segregation ATPase
MIPTPAWKVIFAKIATPFLMNIFQYWMFDVIFLKEYDLVKESLMKEAAAGKLANLELSQEELKEKNKELIKQYDQLKSDYDNQRTEYEANTAILTKQIEEFQEQLEAMAKQEGMPEELVKKIKDKQITLQAALKTHQDDLEKARQAFEEKEKEQKAKQANQNQTQHSGHQNAAFAAVRSFFRW